MAGVALGAETVVVCDRRTGDRVIASVLVKVFVLVGTGAGVGGAMVVGIGVGGCIVVGIGVGGCKVVGAGVGGCKVVGTGVGGCKVVGTGVGGCNVVVGGADVGGGYSQTYPLKMFEPESLSSYH